MARFRSWHFRDAANRWGNNEKNHLERQDFVFGITRDAAKHVEMPRKITSCDTILRFALFSAMQGETWEMT